tara:strand:- start:691 stop:1863 length:1173 start_codon:yes stop_codon:yes gene_type:complete
MVTRVDKFLGGLGADVTNVANVHATQNRITLGGLENPSANAHVIGTVLATTNAIVGATAVTSGHTLDVRGTANTGAISATTITLSADGGVIVPDDGNIGSASSTAAMQIASTGIVTFADDILIKDGGTIGAASAVDAMTVASDGIVTFKDDILIKDGGTIGVASSAGAITIASTGVVTFVDDLVIKDTGTIGSATTPTAIGIAGNGNITFAGNITVPDAGTIGSATDGDAIAIGSDGDVTLTQDLELQHDGATISFGGNDEIVLEHVHNTGLKLTDTGGSPTLQFHDAGESISSDGSKLILTTNSVALSMPTADGSDGQALVTDGSGTLSFTTISTTTNPVTILGSNHDCGAVTGGTNDAFNIATSALTVLDLLTDPSRQLGTADQGALS